MSRLKGIKSFWCDRHAEKETDLVTNDLGLGPKRLRESSGVYAPFPSLSEENRLLPFPHFDLVSSIGDRGPPQWNGLFSPAPSLTGRLPEAGRGLPPLFLSLPCLRSPLSLSRGEWGVELPFPSLTSPPPPPLLPGEGSVKGEREAGLRSRLVIVNTTADRQGDQKWRRFRSLGILGRQPARKRCPAFSGDATCFEARSDNRGGEYASLTGKAAGRPACFSLT